MTFIRTTDNKKLVFISNDFERTAEEIATLYKQRWEIELFFKWIKQNLKIKRFMGRSENSVLIQARVTMIAYLLLRLTQITSYCSLSLQQISRLIAINLTARTSMLTLLHPSPGPGTTRKVDSKQLSLGLADA
jgi:transposase